MSLVCWLPLNGNLDNQGLSDITVTNNGATVNNNGKIGKCYKCSGDSRISFPSFNWMTMKPQNNFSFFFWAKGTTTGWLFACSAWEFRLCPGYIQIHLAGNGQYPARYTDTFDTNTWYHLGFTWSGNNGKLLLYLNGSKVAESDVPSTANFDIASTFNLPYDGPRYLNDVRIYDHCLSPLEVKQISQGLVLHYPLCNIAEVQTLNNVYQYPTFDTSSSKGGWGHWGQSGSSGSYSQNTSKNYIFNSSQTYSHNVSNSASATGNYLLYQEILFSGGYRCMQAIIKESNSLPITDSICYPAWNGSTSLSVANGHWTSIVPLGDGFYLCKVEGINQTTSPSNSNNHLVGIYVKPGYSIYVSECYVENIKHCSYIGNDNNDTTVYDCSGFSNNGAINGTINWSDDTPRCSGSYIPITASSYISTTLNTSGYTNSYTFSYWSKISDMSSKMAWGFGNGNRLNLYPTGSAFCWNTGDGGSNPFKNNGTNVSFSSYNGSWHHYAITGNGTTTTLYIDGEKKGTANTYKAITGTQLYISGWDTGSSYKWTGGNISDFRIYATCLSDEDVKELYQVSASVDKSGILSCYEFSDDGNNEITKNGVISFSDLYESDDISSVGIGKDIIQANKFIEL